MTVTEQLREYEIRVWAEVLRHSRSLTYDGVYGDFVPDDRQLAQLALGGWCFSSRGGAASC